MLWAANLYNYWAKRRLRLTLGLLFALAWAFWGVSGLSPDNSLKPLFPDSSAQMRQSVDLLEVAPFSTLTLVQLTADDPHLAAELPLAADNFLARLSPELATPLKSELPDLQKVMALLPALCDRQCLDQVERLGQGPQLEKIMAATREDLSLFSGYSDLFWRLDPLKLSGYVFGKLPQNSGWPKPDPIIGHQISPDSRHLLIMLQTKVSMSDPEGSKALMAELTRLKAELPPGLSMQISGSQRHTAANAEAIERDLRLTVALALFLILAIYLFLVRSLGALWLFLTPAVAVLAAAALLKMAFPVVSGLALGFGAAVLGIAEDYAVHVHYALRRAESKPEALTHIARPLLMSGVLCVAGFGVLLWSAVPAIRQLAFFSAAAIVVGYLWAIVVLPHCPAIDRPREAALAVPAAALAKGRIRGLWPLLAGLAALATFLISQVPIQISIKTMGLSDPEIRGDEAMLEQIWPMTGRRLYLVPGENIDEALDWAGRMGRAINEQSPAAAASLADILPSRARQEANMAAWKNFMAEDGQKIAAELKEAAGKAGFVPGAFDPFLEWFLAAPQLITPERLKQAGLGPLVESFLLGPPDKPLALVMVDSAAPAPPPEFAGRAVSLSPTDLERELSRALAGEKRLLPFCVIICLGILGWTFRDVNRALLAFIPAMAALTAVLALQLILNRPLGLAEAAALPLIICLGSDYGIVVVSELIDNADFGAGRAIFVSGLSTLAGIGILILAQHPVMHALGRTVFMGLAVAMPVSILLPKMYVREAGTD